MDESTSRSLAISGVHWACCEPRESRVKNQSQDWFDLAISKIFEFMVDCNMPCMQLQLKLLIFCSTTWLNLCRCSPVKDFLSSEDWLKQSCYHPLTKKNSRQLKLDILQACHVEQRHSDQAKHLISSHCNIRASTIAPEKPEGLTWKHPQVKRMMISDISTCQPDSRCIWQPSGVERFPQISSHKWQA